MRFYEREFSRKISSTYMVHIYQRRTLHLVENDEARHGLNQIGVRSGKIAPHKKRKAQNPA
jgi:hypothetical protein